MARPAWWPGLEPSSRPGRTESAKEIGLLDVRDGVCRVCFLDPGSGKVESFSEPSVVRQHGDGSFSHWGRRALAWKDRLSEGQVREVFPSGWPIDPAVSRRFLRKLHETYLSRRGGCRVFLVESQTLSWVRQLWRETLEDSAFTLQGFLTPWQHDLLLVKGAEPEQALSPFLHFRIDDAIASWTLLEGGEVAGEGRHAGLTAGRLLGQLGSYLRRHSSIEVAPGALRALLLASRPELVPAELSLAFAGRQVLSGLPARQTFSWRDFLATQPSVVDSWREVRARIFTQAEEICGWSPGPGEGLDLPGWRVLTGSALASLFVEGPVVKLWDKR